MTYDIFIALAAFALVTSITPGPNNLMLMASGANFGFRRSIPHMLGVSLGFVAMVIIVGAGLIQIFDAWPISYTVLKVVSVAYLLYLAWKIANAAPTSESGKTSTPMTFVQAALFQWVNPKAWAMALTSVSVYAPTQSLLAIIAVAVVFGVINLPSVGVWVTLGQQVRRFLGSEHRLRIFNIVMALLLIASLYPVLFAAL